MFCPDPGPPSSALLWSLGSAILQSIAWEQAGASCSHPWALCWCSGALDLSGYREVVMLILCTALQGRLESSGPRLPLGTECVSRMVY